MFLNVSGSLSEDGWDNPRRDKLWRYNQHYFDDLNAQNSSNRSEWHSLLMADWIARNLPGKGTGWEPYPTSLRIVNWIKWALNGNSLGDVALHSLAVQSRWLCRRLEWHLLGNHLLSNAKALVFSGLFFEGAEAERWLQTGLSILESELPKQILLDGGHFELSTMYHALALEDCLDLFNLAQVYCVPETDDLIQMCREHIPPMQRWLYAMSHPDGGISFFNDAAFEVAADTAELNNYASRLDFTSRVVLDSIEWLACSGYARLEQANAVLILDMARVGADYLPGHAHADTLSFELSLFCQRVFVNCGTSIYGSSQERQRQRGTAAHTTVTIAERNSSDVWSGFRVGRRATPIGARVNREGPTLIAEAGHDGYSDLPGRPIHRRHWHFSPLTLTIVDEIGVVDEIVAGKKIDAEAHFHLHPDIEIQQLSAREGTLNLPGGQKVRWHCERGEVRVGPTTWHPEFGLSIKSSYLIITSDDGCCKLNVHWS